MKIRTQATINKMHNRKIKNKLRQQNLKIAKADRNNATVIRNETEYIPKTKEFAENNNCILLRKIQVKNITQKQ